MRHRAEGEGENEKSSQSLNKQQSLHKLPEMLEQESAKTDRESEKSHKYLNKNKGVPSLLDGQLPERSEDHDLIKKVMGPFDPQPADLNDIRSDDYFTKHAKN